MKNKESIKRTLKPSVEYSGSPIVLGRILKRSIRSFLLMCALLALSSGSQIQAMDITSVISNGPLCIGETLVLGATCDPGEGATGPIRMAGIGNNDGNQEFNEVFSSGDRAGSIERISAATYNSQTPEQLRKKYDVLLFTWATTTSLNGDWATRIKPFIDLGGSIFWEDDRNIGDLAPEVIGNQFDGSYGSSYTISAVPGLTDGIVGHFANHHLRVTSWSSVFSPYITGGGNTLALHGSYPSGGRMIVQGPDQDFHASRGGSNPGGNQYHLILNQLDWLTVFQNATFTWTGPNGFIATGPNPTLANVTTANAGTYTVTCTNDDGNSASARIVVGIKDKPPVAKCQDITIQLDAFGNASISASQIDNGSTDDCGIASISVSQSSFSCADVGANSVKLTVTDTNGNTNSCVATVTVQDNIAPVITLIGANPQLIECRASYVELGATAADNCNLTLGLVIIDASAVNTSTPGSYSVIYDISDASGNAALQLTRTVNVVDTVAPVISIPATDQVVECDGAGNVAELQAWLNSNAGATAKDACSEVAWTNDFTALSDGCGATGSALVTFTAKDAHGNSVSTTASFSVIDTTAPALG
ncbi:MAG: hypothetical protein ACI9NC_002186, partial [Verrucomicrobiales bacterium]